MSSLNRIGFPFVELHTVDSTNNYAMGLVHAGMAQHGMAVFAHEQTRGRGQRQKEWLSSGQNNVALSLILQPGGLKISEAFLVSKTVATAAALFFGNYANGVVCIKWPNDIYWNDRKAGGILIENVVQGSQWKWAVAGIGINVNQTDFGELAGKAVSLKQITGTVFEPVRLARELSEFVEGQFQVMLEDPVRITATYHRFLYKRDQRIKLRKGPAVFEALIKEVNDEGQLIAEHAIEEKFAVGEVEWVL